MVLPTAESSRACFTPAHHSSLTTVSHHTLHLLLQAWQRQFGAGQRNVDLLHSALTLILATRTIARQQCAPSCLLWLTSLAAVLPVPVLALAAPQHYTAIRTPLLLIIRIIRWTLNIWGLLVPSQEAMMHTMGDCPGSRLHFHILLTAPILLTSSAVGFALPLKVHAPVQLLAQVVTATYSARGCKVMCHHRGMRDWYAHVASSLRALSNFAMVSGGCGEPVMGGLTALHFALPPPQPLARIPHPPLLRRPTRRWCRRRPGLYTIPARPIA